MRRVTLELPGGKIDGAETAAEAGTRELREETGFVAPLLELLGCRSTSTRRRPPIGGTSFSRSTPSELLVPEPHEMETPRSCWCRSPSVAAMIDDGQICGAASVAGLLQALRRVPYGECRKGRGSSAGGPAAYRVASRRRGAAGAPPRPARGRGHATPAGRSCGTRGRRAPRRGARRSPDRGECRLDPFLSDLLRDGRDRVRGGPATYESSGRCSRPLRDDAPEPRREARLGTRYDTRDLPGRRAAGWRRRRSRRAPRRPTSCSRTSRPCASTPGESDSRTTPRPISRVRRSASSSIHASMRTRFVSASCTIAALAQAAAQAGPQPASQLGSQRRGGAPAPRAGSTRGAPPGRTSSAAATCTARPPRRRRSPGRRRRRRPPRQRGRSPRGCRRRRSR